jgi:hypothetical protein
VHACEDQKRGELDQHSLVGMGNPPEGKESGALLTSPRSTTSDHKKDANSKTVLAAEEAGACPQGFFTGGST